MVARGWESKSVEEQQSAAQTQAETRKLLTPEEVAEQRKREALLLSRSHVQAQLQTAQNPRHREMLQTALAELNARLARLPKLLV
jgi:type IV secretory pathway TraG/TraD family ATPase VirD4